MITLIIKQRIILAHIDGMGNRAIANLLHLSKDTVNKYANEYNEKREELLRMNPDMDTSEIIQAFIEKPTYDSSNRIPSKATPELLEAVKKCLQLNRDKRLMGMQKQTMKKIDIHDYLKKQGFDVSYSTVKRATQYLETKHQEAFIRQGYMPGESVSSTGEQSNLISGIPVAKSIKWLSLPPHTEISDMPACI